MQFYPYGPFEMTRDGAAVSRHRTDKKRFWDAVENEVSGLSDACGCYIFVVRGRAWYVGLAEKQSFKREIFQHHKLFLYGEALRKVSGRATFLFLAKLTPGDRFAKPSRMYGHRDIQFLEKLVIGSAVQRNLHLRNVKETKLLREMHVPGLLNRKPGEGKAAAVQAFRTAVGV